MTQIEKPELNMRDLVEKAIFQAVENVNDELNGEYQFKVYSVWVRVENYDSSIEINMSYSIKLYEISEAVSEGFSEYIYRIEEEEGRELTEEEIEKLYNELYDNELSELNSEYAYFVNAEIEYDLSDIYPFYSGGLEIEINPLTCDSDYCDIGSEITIKFKAIRIETIEKASDKFTEFLTDLLRIIHNVITL
jgi:predicted hydrocarbon binding protein